MTNPSEPSPSSEPDEAKEKTIPGIYGIRLKKGPQLRAKPEAPLQEKPGEDER